MMFNNRGNGSFANSSYLSKDKLFSPAAPTLNQLTQQQKKLKEEEE